jgi:penicillin-binding protein 2
MARIDLEELAFEDSLRDDWSRDLETVEISLERRAGWYIALAAVAVLAIIAGRVFYLSVIRGDYYTASAQANVNHIDRILAPRGLIVDRNGQTLAENQPIFSAVLDLRRFLREPEARPEVFAAAADILDLPRAELEARVTEASERDSGQPVVLAADITQQQVVALSARGLPALTVQNDFKRVYPDTRNFSSVLGYVGLPTAEELRQNPGLSTQDLVGKAGVEAFYDERLQGEPGAYLKFRDARGNVLREERTAEPQIGPTLELAIDAEFQKYFVERMQSGLNVLGRIGGVAMAINPQNGEVLALASFPTFDNGILSGSGRVEEKRAILNSVDKPLFNRAVSGRYSPGSTIKPLHGVAVLKEGVIDPHRTIFSPGYLDIPNPYDPSKPTRYLDWRYQGDVNLYSAIAQSSDVYFYQTVGGFGGQRGIGITRLREWWQRFLLDQKTGIDLPAEGVGFLPSPEWKENRDARPWLLGDTYNVAIGQGDLDITNIQLLNYITAIANGGTIYKPVVNRAASQNTVLADLTEFAPEIVEAQKGMRLTVTSALGTAHALDGLPFPVNAKTGSAQVLLNTQENAFFVGYIPTTPSGVDNGSEIAILILVEHAKQGSSNTLPVARDVLQWYWENRLQNIQGQGA